MIETLYAIGAALCAFTSLALLLAVYMAETGQKIGGITFYRVGRWRASLCRVKGGEA